MKLNKQIIKLLLLISLIIACNSCLTATNVKTIVAESNMASVNSILTVDPADGNKWLESYNKLEEQISINKDQTVLVDQLRLRQALLLTVNKKKALANRKWSEISVQNLPSSRDQTLYSHRKFLVWWYTREGDNSNLDNAVEKFEPYLTSLRASIKSQNTDPTLKKYLGILKAQVTYKRNSKLITNTSDLKEKAKTMVQNDYNDLRAAFSAKDLELLDNGKIDELIAEAKSSNIAEIRYLFFLQEMTNKYKGLPNRLGISLSL